MEWIEVEHRLPPSWLMVLVINIKHSAMEIVMATYDEGSKCWYRYMSQENYRFPIEITHWCKIELPNTITRKK